MWVWLFLKRLFSLKCCSYRPQPFFRDPAPLREPGPICPHVLCSHIRPLASRPKPTTAPANAPLKSLGWSKRSRIWSRKRRLLWQMLVTPKQKQGRQEALGSR